MVFLWPVAVDALKSVKVQEKNIQNVALLVKFPKEGDLRPFKFDAGYNWALHFPFIFSSPQAPSDGTQKLIKNLCAKCIMAS